VDVLNTINFPQRFRGRANLGWRKDAFSAVAFVNLTDSYTQNTVTPARKVPDYVTVDLHAAVDLGELTKQSLLNETTLAIDAQNLFDRDPPFVNVAGGYDSQSVNPIGRLVAVSLRKRW
jgi:iron complex outermembrane receptor protein